MIEIAKHQIQYIIIKVYINKSPEIKNYNS